MTGPEVDQVHRERLEVHENVLVLDVAVDDSGFVTGQHALNDLLEEEPGQRLFEHALLGDVVEQVLDGLWPLHDEDKGIGPLVPVEETNDARYVGHLEQQVDLERDPLTVQLRAHRKTHTSLFWLRRRATFCTETMHKARAGEARYECASIPVASS